MKTLTADEFKKVYGSEANKLINSGVTSELQQKGDRADEFLNKTSIEQIFTPEFLKSVPRGAYDTLVGNTLKFIKSATESPINIGESLIGKPQTSFNINDPVTHKPINSYQNDFQNKTLPSVESGNMSPLNATLKTTGATLGGALDTLGATSLIDGVAKSVPKFIDGIGSVEKYVDNVASKIKNVSVLPNARQKIIDFVSRDPDVKTATILKETKPEKLNQYVEIAKQASTDPRKLTPFEVVGDKMSEVTKKLSKMKDEIGKQKSSYMEGLRYGFDSFDTKPFIQKVNSLNNDINANGDRKILKEIIDRAKEIKTKRSADKFIDDIQERLYKGNRDMTIPSGTTLDKRLRSIVGEMNTQLRNSLPKEYGQLNAKFSNLSKVVSSLNTSLGEVVDGVSTRGSGLIKQFFSPNGRKAKELFEYIKKTTGVDLAQDSTLARFTMELFDDPRARSLLEGIPTSPSGIIQRGVDFVADKTGLTKGFQNTLRESQIRKAKNLTK